MTEELNRRHNLATTPTTNNNGESYIVPFDIYKEGYDAYDISNWFKGRVGDNGTPFGIRWYKHGQLMDVTGMRPFIEGQVGDYTIDDSDPDDPKINMDSEASNVHVVGEVNDCQEYGVAIYRLINQAMPQSGIFYGKIGVMGAQDDGTTVMSSVDVVFKVLAGHMNMLGARKFYVTELEKAWLDLRAKFKQYNQEYKDTTTKQAEQFKADTENALADLNTKIANEIKRAEDTLGDTQASIDSNIASLKRIAATCASIQAEIDANDIVKLSDFKDQTNALANGQKNLTSTITSKLATLSAQPELFNSSSDIKAKYPNGSTGVKIATDTWHGWGYINDSWEDLGDYKPTSVPPIQLANASTAYLDYGNQISFRKLNDGNTAFKLPKGVNIIGHSVAVKLDDIKAAAVNSSNVKYEDGEFVGNTFLCIYHPSTKTVSFESSYANTNPEDLILFGVMWNSWIGGVLIQDSYNDRVENSARPWYGYLYGRTPLLEFSEVLGKSTTLSLDFNITIYGNQKYVDLTKEKITSDIQEQLKTAPVEGITYDEKDFKLSSDEFSLIYDFADQKVKVAHSGLPTLTSQQVNIFSQYFGNDFAGIAYEDYFKQTVKNSARPWYGYLYGRTPLLEFSEVLGKSTTLSLDFNITIYGNQKYVDLTKEKITSDITEQLKTAPFQGIFYDEKTYKLTSDEFSLIYDFADQKVKVAHSGLPTLTSQQVNIFSQYFGNDFAGIAYEDYFKQTVKNSARPWYGYLYGRTPLLEFSEVLGKSTTLSLDFNITIYGNQKYVDLTKEKITSDIQEQLKTAPVEGITYDEKDFKLSSDEFSLIYDFADQKVKVFHKAFLDLTSMQVNLFSDYFGNGSIQGIAYEDYLKRKRTIPEYWQTELNQKIAEIQNNVCKIENGLSFLWITDIHWENNDKLSPMLIKQLLSRTNVSYMIDGGDHFNAGFTIEEAINKLSEGYSNLTVPGIDHISVVGNHDDNKMLWSPDPAMVLQNYQIFNAMFPHTLHSVDLKMTNYPVDLSWELKFNQNPELINHKYQYAAFGFDGRLEASKDQILKFVEFCKNPYKILAFTHGILDYGSWLQWGTDLGKIIDAINNQDTNVSTESYGVIDLKGVQAKVIALISGHEHQDNVKYTAGGTPLIVTDSDCGIQTYKNTKYPYKKGTITEQSFSVFSIDLDNSKIYEVKVGRGEDREFNIPEICKDDPQPTQPASGTESAKSEPAKQDETKPATPQIQPVKQDTGENSPKSAEPQAQPTETKKDSDKQ